MRALAILLASVALVACQKAPEQSTQQGPFVVEKLFTYEGCTVYRFNDVRTVYYTNCNGQTQAEYGCGKNCNEDHGVSTSARR